MGCSGGAPTAGVDLEGSMGLCSIEGLDEGARQQVCSSSTGVVLAGGIGCQEVEVFNRAPTTYVASRFFCLRNESGIIGGGSRSESVRQSLRAAKAAGSTSLDVAAWSARNPSAVGSPPERDSPVGIVIEEKDYWARMSALRNTASTGPPFRLQVSVRTVLDEKPVVLHAYRSYEDANSVPKTIADARGIATALIAAD
jgi:hypothetical protein